MYHCKTPYPRRCPICADVFAVSLPMKKLLDKAVLLFYKLAASGLVPDRWFSPGLPREEERVGVSGRLRAPIEHQCGL